VDKKREGSELGKEGQSVTRGGKRWKKKIIVKITGFKR